MIAAFLLAAGTAHAALESVTLSSKDQFPAPRWMYGVGPAPKQGSPKDASFALSKVKQAQVAGDFAQCAQLARDARPKAKSLQGWLSVVELECAVKVKPSMKSSFALSQALDFASSHQDFFVTGPQASRLKSTFGAGLLALIDQDLKVNRARAWKSIERVDEFSNLFDDRTKATALKAAGDLSVAQQKPAAARDFYKRALALSGDGETRDKLAAVERVLGVKPKASPTPAVTTDVAATPTPSDANSEATPEELDLADRATTALKSGDIVVAMDDCVQLILKYPAGTRAKWASDRINETIASFADKTDPKYQDLHDQVLDRVLRADSDHLVDWGRACYNRAQFTEAAMLGKRSLDHTDGARRAKALDLASQAAIAVDDWATARAALQELVDKAAGQPSSREALFKLGLLNYRESRATDAVMNFERLLALPQTDNLELGAKYWLWRSLQKTKSDRAARVADEIMTKFPFSYYGLRARLEAGQGTLEWKPPTPAEDKVESTLWLLPSDKLAWERAQLLLRSGWLDEAQAEFRELPAPVTANDKAVRALLYAAAGGYVTASRLTNDAWDENSDFRRAPFIDAVFPREFTEFIEANAKKRSLDRDLVRGLIKQESSYNPKAVSVSNAYGLMQMIPPTAREIAQDLHLGALKLPDDMFVPKRNIEMGTYYLSRMVNRYQGSVPLALAAYNAGPGRIDRWIRAKPSMKTVASTKSSAPDDEIWFDEIPYNETCFYVKAILRNVMLYRLLDQGRVQMPNPIWSPSTAANN